MAAIRCVRCGDGPEPDGAVEHGVERGHHRQQRLRGAHVGGGLLAADVLLAGLEGEPVGAGARRVDGDADEPPGHGALEVVSAGHERGVRAAEAHRHAEPLRRPDGDVGAHGAGFLQHAERQQVRGHDGHRARGVQR